MKTPVKSVLYGGLFVLIIPALLIVWAHGLEDVLHGLPEVGTPIIGWIVAAIGFCIMAAGWLAIVRHGKGLPMNITPPPNMVKSGIYSMLPHPIYAGFTILAAGYFMAIMLPAGFWIVTPCIMLGCAALVFGYERHDMRARFGTTAVWTTFLHLPEAVDAPPTVSDRISAYLCVFLPWFALYEAVILFGPAPDAVAGYLPFEYGLPVIQWTEAIYAFTYLFVLAAPLCARRKIDLRRFMQMGLLATAIGIFCFWLFPVSAPPRPFEASGIWGKLLVFERATDGAAAAFPSFHVLWACLAAWLYGRSFGKKLFWYALTLLIALSCLMTGMHSILDIIGTVGVFATVVNSTRLWSWILRVTERVANSWREWRVGPLRILLHAVYSWAGAFVGVVITVHLTGKAHMGHLLLIGVCVVLGSGTWGQFLKGKANLARPFGFFGGLIGGIVGVFAVNALGGNGWLLAGAFAVAIPFIQAVGRLRCLVQGCCHGRECRAHEGIVVKREKSRVAYLAHLDHRPLYPTPLYSMVYNLILGPILFRAWTLALPLPFIVGMYLILGGMGRFVEESYRGVPHTQKFGGLIVYQWLAMLAIVSGAVLTTFQGPAYLYEPAFILQAFFYATVFGLFAAFALSMDFPESNRRFSRLAPP